MQQLVDEKKHQINADFDEIKEELNPIKQVTHAVQNILVNHNHDKIIKMGVNLAVDLILTRLVLKKAGWATKVIVPFVVKNIVLNYLDKHRDEILTKSLYLVKKLAAKKQSDKNYNEVTINYPASKKLSVEGTFNNIY